MLDYFKPLRWSKAFSVNSDIKHDIGYFRRSHYSVPPVLIVYMNLSLRCYAEDTILYLRSFINSCMSLAAADLLQLNQSKSKIALFNHANSRILTPKQGNLSNNIRSSISPPLKPQHVFWVLSVAANYLYILNIMFIN